jgi:hypothetical protein
VALSCIFMSSRTNEAGTSPPLRFMAFADSGLIRADQLTSRSSTKSQHATTLSASSTSSGVGSPPATTATSMASEAA